jgi:flagellar biosynthetic protein FliO
MTKILLTLLCSFLAFSVSASENNLNKIQVKENNGYKEVFTTFDRNVGTNPEVKATDSYIQVDIPDVSTKGLSRNRLNGMTVKTYPLKTGGVRQRITFDHKVDFSERPYASVGNKSISLVLPVNLSGEKSAGSHKAKAEIIRKEEAQREAHKLANKPKSPPLMNARSDGDEKLDSHQKDLIKQMMSSNQKDKPGDAEQRRRASERTTSEQSRRGKEKQVARDSQSKKESRSWTMSALYITGALFVVLAIIFLTFLGFKKLLDGDSPITKAFRKNSDKNIEVIESHYLGPKRSISLIRVLDRVVVIGLTDQNITKLSDVTDSPKAQRLLQEGQFGKTFEKEVAGEDQYVNRQELKALAESEDKESKVQWPARSRRFGKRTRKKAEFEVQGS